MADAVPLGRLAFNSRVWPSPRVSFDADRVTLEGALTTLTSQAADSSPQVTVIVALPAFLAVSLPSALTETILLEEVR